MLISVITGKRTGNFFCRTQKRAWIAGFSDFNGAKQGINREKSRVTSLKAKPEIGHGGFAARVTEQLLENGGLLQSNQDQLNLACNVCRKQKTSAQHS